MRQTIQKFLLVILTFMMISLESTSQAVMSGPGPMLILKKGTTIDLSYIGPDPDIFAGLRIQTSIINVQFNGPWPGPAMAAFSYAVDIMEHTITSNVAIDIEAHWDPLSTITGNPDILGAALAHSMVRDFNTPDPRFFPSTFYAVALANKMSGVDHATGAGGQDIDCFFNSDFPNWYFGTDGNPGPSSNDFVSVVFHEICHGIGFFSSADIDQQPPNNLFWSESGFPVVFDHFITNQLGVKLTSFPVSSSSLTAYLQSDQLFFNGSNTTLANGGSAKIYAPSLWEDGSSGSHFNQITFQSTPNKLMCPGLNQGAAIHNPGPVGVGLLNDIGWDAILWIGIEDRINIYGPGGCCPFPVPERVLHEGGSYGYQMQFYDEDPYGDYLTGQYNWNVELLHHNGRYLLQSFSGSPSYNFTLNNLPLGYDWHRDLNGRVMAVISASGIDNDNILHQTELKIGIDYMPGQATINIKNACIPIDEIEPAFETEIVANSSVYEWIERMEDDITLTTEYRDPYISKIVELGAEWFGWRSENPSDDDIPEQVEPIVVEVTNCCNAVTVNFFSYSALSYSILYRKVNDMVFLSTPVTAGEYSKVIGHLEEYSNYVFYVIADNTFGSIISEPVYRYACKTQNPSGGGGIHNRVILYPNPTDDELMITLNEEELTKITSVRIVSIANPNIQSHTYFENPESEAIIPVSQFNTGYYSAIIYTESNIIFSAIFYKN